MVKRGTERDRQTETGVCAGERIQMREREREGGRGIETRMGERQSDRSVRKGERQGWEREKDKKIFRVGERKIRRETGVVERGRQELERERERIKR